jgi:hypothetical protein
MANKFALRHDEIEIDYTIGMNPGFTALVYRHGGETLSFKPAEITTDNTALGTLVSVPVVRTVDTGGETFGFLLPEVDLPLGQSAECATAGVYERFSGPDSFPKRPPHWRAIELRGTAETVIVPLADPAQAG